MYSHSVTLDSSKCRGCTDCIKRCPTEAIRVRDSKAKIINDRCIDCGNCIAVCNNGAKKAVMDSIGMIKAYPYRIALTAPSFYAQFSKGESIENIIAALYTIGFTDVFEVSQAAQIITKHTQEYMKSDREYPVISSACPVIMRLIQRRFPALIHHVLPIMSPMELAARYVKETYARAGIDVSQVGVFFISPCPAKATDIHKPKGFEKSYVDGAFSMQEIYLKVIHTMEGTYLKQKKRVPSPDGILWATRNGGVSNNEIDNHIAVDGIERVIDILEKVEDGTLSKIHYIEALACTGGCLGGALTIENPFVSRHTLKKLVEKERKLLGDKAIQEDTLLEEIPYLYNISVDPKPVFSLDEDLETAIEMMEHIESLYKQLPQIDCGSCGAPTCRCFAEDVVKGCANVEDCIFMLRKRIKELSESMFELTKKILPTTKG
ncbi:[Fe-Fe] hydrogenase large subunit C-terminal domain-containing protein [Zhenhengia yiwuensis]|uniref:[Fe-Fe] hydrogenase large subunit C-terminal domain-containing protein n=1 Tax=Zhenhengia yiwuensis TaxID=2763666 RepID=UPI001B66C705|nr:[Fe-Fe] hydrogenase large subunit C-terminal domain-containing protein [Zhenhengia yiwuensis]MBP3912694.1 4Fe-4S dicluster domain-containing protein [Niameybacter sp.]MDY3367655.1 [Fe-Fe] hydrogenase large subunit C-terminal domain-containing protein [Zhenhengia yiwuensis]